MTWTMDNPWPFGLSVGGVVISGILLWFFVMRSDRAPAWRLFSDLEDDRAPTLDLGLRLAGVLVLTGAFVGFALKILDHLANGRSDGHVLGVPIAHVTAGVLAVLAGTVAAVHTQRGTRNQESQIEIDRTRSEREWFARWVQETRSVHLHTVAWTNIERVLREDERGDFLEPAVRLAEDSIIQYFVSPCLQETCDQRDSACQRHRVDPTWLAESARVLEVSRELVADSRQDQPFNLRGSVILRGGDMDVHSTVIRKADLTDAVVTTEQPLRLLQTQLVGDTIPRLADGAHLILSFDGWTCTDVTFPHQGSITLRPAPVAASLKAERLVVPADCKIEVDLTGSQGCTIEIDELDLHGTLKFTGQASDLTVALHDARDLGGQLSFHGADFSKSLVSVNVRHTGAASAQPFLNLDGLTAVDSSIDVTNLVPRSVRSSSGLPARSWSIKGAALSSSALSLGLASLEAEEIALRIADCLFEGASDTPAALALEVMGNRGSTSSRITVEPRQWRDTNLTVKHVDCASGDFIFFAPPAFKTSGNVTLGTPTMSSAAGPTGVSHATPEGGEPTSRQTAWRGSFSAFDANDVDLNIIASNEWIIERSVAGPVAPSAVQLPVKAG